MLRITPTSIIRRLKISLHIFLIFLFLKVYTICCLPTSIFSLHDIWRGHITTETDVNSVNPLNYQLVLLLTTSYNRKSDKKIYSRTSRLKCTGKFIMIWVLSWCTSKPAGNYRIIVFALLCYSRSSFRHRVDRYTRM